MIIFLFISLIIKYSYIFDNLNLLNLKNHDENRILENTVGDCENNNDNIDSDNNLEDSNWYIEIPSINLKASISEGIDDNTLKKYIGHFNETDCTVGNIGLAAHNRGYENNYFKDLKSVQKGDEIIYKYNNFSMTYVIDTIEIIRNTDWSFLERDDENKITLITCVENEPNFRRCVQAVEKEK